MKTLLLFDTNANEVPKHIPNNTLDFYVKVFNNISSFLNGCKIYELELDYNGDDYYYDCFTNNIDQEFQTKFINHLPLNDSFDLVITNSCNPIVRKIFPYVLNLSMGIFGSRPPYPISYNLDPWGQFCQSLTYNAPLINNIKSDVENSKRFLRKIRHHYPVLTQYKDINLFPFNSESHPYHIQKLKKSQIDYFKDFEYKNNGKVRWTKKPKVNILNKTFEFDYEYLQELPQEKKIDINSSFLIPYCKKIWASHSTLGFQAALHNVEIDSPSCFYYWKGDRQGTIGALLDLVWFYDIGSFYDRIEKLKEFKTIPESLKTASFDIHTYVNSDLNSITVNSSNFNQQNNNDFEYM